MSIISETNIHSTAPKMAAERTSLFEWTRNYLNQQVAPWLDYLVTPTPLFPPDFIEELEKSNENMSDAPIALIVYATDDFNEALSSRASLSVIKQIAKTHKVVLTTLRSHYLLGARIEKTAQEQNKPISLLYMAGHGTKESIRFGKSGFSSVCPQLTIKDLYLHEKDFTFLSKDAPIILYSCNTGKDDFAKQLARVAQRCVLAPIETLPAATTVFRSSPGQSPEILSYNQEHKQIIQKHFPNGDVKLDETPEDTPEIQTLLQEKYSYLIESADAGDVQAQLHLGLLYRDGIGVEESIENALVWLERAAEQGSWKAQAAISQLHEFQTGNFAEALRWYRTLALQGCEGADEKIKTMEMYLRGC